MAKVVYLKNKSNISDCFLQYDDKLKYNDF